MIKDIKRITSRELIPEIESMLCSGTNVKMTVTGNSMYPFLREGVDSVVLSPVKPNNLKRGDIILARRETGQHVLHRIFRKGQKSIYLLGDAQQMVEGPLRPEQVIAVVTSVWRRDKVLDCNGLVWRILSGLWLKVRTWRRHIIYGYSILRRWI